MLIILTGELLVFLLKYATSMQDIGKALTSMWLCVCLFNLCTTLNLIMYCKNTKSFCVHMKDFFLLCSLIKLVITNCLKIL